MKIVKTTALNEKQTAEIEALVCACKQVCPLTLSFPFDEEASFYLLYDPALVCALSLILPVSDCPDEAAECVAFTLPPRQHMGYFTALFAAAEEEIEDTDLLFLTDNSNEGAAKALAALPAEFDFDEYKMDLDLKHAPAANPDGDGFRLLSEAVTDENCVTFTFRLKSDPDGPCVGNCHALISETAACLYSFMIEALFRGRGLGTEALLLTLSYLNMKHCTSVSLHVSGDNEAAVHLYRKTGFRITETLSYYLY